MRSRRAPGWFRFGFRVFLVAALCAVVLGHWYRHRVQTFIRHQIAPRRMMRYRMRPPNRRLIKHEAPVDEEVEHLEHTLEQLRISINDDSE